MSADAHIKRPELGGEVSESEVKLCAGPLRMIFDHGDLRYITFREREIVRRIYAAVRDRNWGTVLGTRSNLKIDSGRDFFQISYDSEHTKDDISFVWHAEISGDTDGTIKFSFDGEARSMFLKNRIGLCVLHPMELAGEKCLLERDDGIKHEAQFPKLVAQEQPVRDLFNLKGLAHKIGPDAWLEIFFKGDLFETEDQRNWIDASFKTYSTPQHLPYPVEIQRGTRITQSVILKLGGDLSKEPIAVFEEPPPIELKSDFSIGRALPKIGFGVSSFGAQYSDKTIQRLKALKPAHLRLDLNLSALSDPLENAFWTSPPQEALQYAIWESCALNSPLEIALTIPKDEEGNLRRKHEWEWIQKQAHQHLTQIKCWLILSDGAKSTTPESFAAAKLALNGFGPVGVGTAADFYQLNQQRPPWERSFFVGWSMNPQVHAFDDLSLAETAAAIPAQIDSARNYFPNKPLHISPITLKPRLNPALYNSNTQLPADVDPRQSSLMGAAWTLAVLQNLVEARVNSVTFYETVGWRGLIEREAGSPLPEKFPSVAGGVFPAYYIFRWVADFPNAYVAPVQLSRPNEIAALCLVSGDTYRLIVGNLTPHEQQVKVHGGKKTVQKVLSLHQRSLSFAMQEPEKFPEFTQGLADPKLLSISLLPHELLCVDWKKRQS